MAITKKAASKKVVAKKRPYKRRTAVPENAPDTPTPLLNFDPNKHVIVDLNDPKKVGELLEKLVDQRMEQRTKQYAHIVEEEERIMNAVNRDSSQIRNMQTPPRISSAFISVIERQLKAMGHIETSINKLMSVTNRASGCTFDLLDAAPHMEVGSTNRLDNLQVMTDILEQFGDVLEKVTESLDNVI